MSSALFPSIPYLHALILGLIQGATEFLPVSSTGHMRIVPALLHWPDPGSGFSAIVQLGPIFAIIAYFRNDLSRYVAGILRTLNKKEPQPADDVDARLGWLTVIGTAPMIIGGLLLEHKVDTIFRSLSYVAGGLILFSILLLIAERAGKRVRKLESLTVRDAVIVGLAQVFALVPGASRSGTTITAGLFLNLDREAAARFSFLLSIPAITLAGLYKLAKALKGAHHLGAVLPAYVFAAVVAGLVAYVVIKMFLGYLSEDKHSTMPFIVYRIVLGLVIFYLLHAGMLTPNAGLPAEQTTPAAMQTMNPSLVAVSP